MMQLRRPAWKQYPLKKRNNKLIFTRKEQKTAKLILADFLLLYAQACPRLTFWLKYGKFQCLLNEGLDADLSESGYVQQYFLGETNPRFV